MKTLLSVRRHHYLSRVGTFLIAVALVAAMIVSCAGDGTEPTLDHLRVYPIDDGQQPYVGEPVYFEDRFGSFNATIGWGWTLATPVEKVHDGVTTPISNQDGHYVGYGVEGVEPQWWRVTVSNQFGIQDLIVTGPIGLSPPTRKEPHGSPVGLDYLSAYFVTDAPSLNVVIDLQDQFSDAPQSLVLKPFGFGNPARVTHHGEVTEIVNQHACLVTYTILVEGASTEQHEVVVTNEFGEHSFSVTEQEEGYLAVPCDWVEWELIAAPLDHHRAYDIGVGAGPAGMPYVGERVQLGDQFGNFTATVGWGTVLVNPVQKTYNGVTTPISNEDGHYMAYGLEGVERGWWRVTVSNQFGTQELTVTGPIGLSIPTRKKPHGEPVGLNCFLGYEIINPPSVQVRVDLSDQFGSEQNVLVTQAKGFANPAWMIHDGEVTQIADPDAHGVSYWILTEGAPTKEHEVVLVNEFGEYHLTVVQGEEGALSVPSEKIEWEPIEPPLDHFRCYNADGNTMPYVGEAVVLTDDFGTFTATVGLGTTQCNPVDKAVNEIAAWEWVPISHPDYHLMVYILEDVEPAPGEWVVKVNNQFGEQELSISGPGGLAVPTRKYPHGDPVGLDFFLLYGITEHAPIDVIVDLIDQFGGGDNNFRVIEDDPPWLFAVPAQITHDGEVTGIVNPDDYLVFYHVKDDDAPPGLVRHTVDLLNLFDKFTLDVMQGDEAYLAVPSQRVD